MSAPLSSSDPLIGSVLAERYRIDDLLGEGGMGKVYAAEHVLMRKRLAIKVLHGELCAIPDVVARFEREAMATANIDHPNIAAATDFGRLPDGSLFLVLELVSGLSLRDEIEKGPMPLERALSIAQQIAGALSAAHALGIVHRDLKPENVMLVTRGSNEDFVKVLDFGIAKMPVGNPAGPSASGPLTRAGEVFGTPEYMSPEQALGQTVDGRADLYALGAMTYEMLSGVRPFTSATDTGILAQQLAKPVPPISERAPNVRVPPRVEAVLFKLLAKELGQRYQTADEALQALGDLLQPMPGAPERLFTLTDGSPTAFLGSFPDLRSAGPQAAAAVRAPEVQVTEDAPALPDLVPPPAPPSLAAPQAGPSGTLPMLPDEERAELARNLARARASSRLDPDRIVAGARVALMAICDFIDDNRGRLPPRVRQLLQQVPAAALLTFALVMVWGTTLIATVWAMTPRDVPEPVSSARTAAVASPEPEPDPALSELPTAKQAGHAALVALAEKYPKSAPVWAELAASHARNSDLPAAVTAIDKALAADQSAKEHPTAAEVLADAVRDKQTTDPAFTLLEERMGAAGARVLYDLAIDQKVLRATRQRAESWVRSDEFEKVASPGVQVAAAMRWAKSCSVRYDLLSRAREVGGKRALAFLKIAKIRSGCGRRARDDCFPCLRKDDALAQAISAIEKRLESAPDTP